MAGCYYRALGDPRTPRVSIPSRPYGRLLPQLRAVASLRMRFQSPAGHMAGCYWTRLTLTRWVTCFNPQPAIWPAATEGRPYPRAGGGVSIPSRPYGRLLRPATGAVATLRGVSIPSRPYGRLLLHGGPFAHWTVAVSIPSRPYGRLLPTTRGHSTITTIRFNPQPAIWPAATRAPRINVQSGDGFNPQPAIWPAATGQRCGLGRGRRVSIPSRPYGRLLRRRWCTPPGHRHVSIPSRPYGRLLLNIDRPRAPARAVSIPSRPYGRLLLGTGSGFTAIPWFQSPAGHMAGCY